MADWKFILTDLAGNNPAEIVEADDRKVSTPLNRAATATFKLRTEHRYANRALALNNLLKVYRAGRTQPIFVGPCVSAEEVGNQDSENILVTASDPMFRLARRFIGKTDAGYADTLTTKTKGTLAKNVIDTANGEGWTGIQTNTGWLGDSGTAKLGPVYFKPVSETITEFTQQLPGFDFELVPIEPSGPWPNTSIAEFHTFDQRGIDRPNCVFEYGTSKANVGSYTRTSTLDGIANVVHNNQGFPEASPVVVSDAASINTWSRYDTLIAPELTDVTLRQHIASLHLAFRKQARTVIIFEPFMNATPTPYISYGPGDRVRCRAVVNGSTRFDGLFKVWGIEVSVDTNNNESTVLELTPP